MDGGEFKRNRHARIKVDGDVLRYNPEPNDSSVGCFIIGNPLTEEMSYFEIKIQDCGENGCISVGLVPFNYDLSRQPGWEQWSVGYHADDGMLFSSSGSGTAFGPKCKVGDRMGCGIRKTDEEAESQLQGMMMPSPFKVVQVYFTRNGEEVGQVPIIFPIHTEHLHPAIGMHSPGEAVQILVRPQKLSSSQFPQSVDDFMVVDGADDDWIKTHDVRINGQVIEYIGNGFHIHDVGLAQAKSPLTTTTHYFEIEILEPGQSCYIAIGLVHKDYPLRRHPGWNIGSIAYHADDGKIFLGRGQGTPFGPRCYRGDIMGCGIHFPCDYVTPSDGEDDDNDEELEEEDDAKPLPIPEPRAAMQDANDLVIDLLDDLEDFGSDDDDGVEWHMGKMGLPHFRGRGGIDGDPLDLPVRAFRRNNVERWFNDRKICGMMPRQSADIYGRKGKGLMVKVFFTRNGRRVGQKEVMMPKGGFYPAVGMLSLNEKVKVDLHPLTG
uniref:SPRY domain-containing protein 3-like n=1 Tax=Phallusia mammillata TaxID=59560 RepID=A0A6F9DSY5_9ASCI|nr:SPRY domain-containing protein 3-like [Phallusia mammillata]